MVESSMEPLPSYVRVTNSLSSTFECIPVPIAVHIWIFFLLKLLMQSTESHPALISMVHVQFIGMQNYSTKKVLHWNCSGRFNEMQLILFRSVWTVFSVAMNSFWLCLAFTICSQWHWSNECMCVFVWYRFGFRINSVSMYKYCATFW